jgi:hypothetical protein
MSLFLFYNKKRSFLPTPLYPLKGPAALVVKLFEDIITAGGSSPSGDRGVAGREVKNPV